MKGKKRKKARSAKQKAATRKMLAANKKARHGGGTRKARKNPKRSKARHAPKHARKARKNPKRSKARHAPKRRAARANPKRSSHRKRRHRRNPGLPMWAMGALAAGGAIVVYAVSTGGAFALTQRTDPTLNTLDRNRYILAGVATVGGLLLMLVHPLAGLGVAAGGAAALAGTQAALALGKVIDKTDSKGALVTSTNARQTTAGIMADGRQRFGALNINGRQVLMGAITSGSGRQSFGGVGSGGVGSRGRRPYFGG